jgi:hypothetical protein
LKSKGILKEIEEEWVQRNREEKEQEKREVTITRKMRMETVVFKLILITFF